MQIELTKFMNLEELLAVPPSFHRTFNRYLGVQILGRLLWVFCISFLSAGASKAQDLHLPLGKSTWQVKVRETELELFCYKPDSYDGSRMILVMHGTNRNASEYRDNACSMGDRFGALIIAPKFDIERFPSIKYNRGGIVTQQQQAAPESEWTYHYVPALVQQIRQREGKPNLKFWMIGHSAGGQFIARMSAFLDVGAERLVAANAGSHLFPRFDWPFGYGFGDLPQSLANEERIKVYLAAPLTIYVGTADKQPDEYFDASNEAMLQGPGRMQRGRACFEYAQKLAKQNQWPFNWRLVEAADVAHEHQAMFDHPSCKQALFPE